MEERVWHRHYDEGVPATLDYQDLTLPQNLARAVDRYGDRTALVFLNARLTYRELADEVARLATALSRLGVVKDSRVAIHLPNLPQAAIAYYATLACGAQAVMTNPLYVAREIEFQWRDAGCEVAITADFLFARVLAPIRAELPIRHYIVASIPEYLGAPLSWIAGWKLRRTNPPSVAPIPSGDDVHPFRELVRSTPPEPPDVAIDPGDLAVLQYTGGTTGVSKAAMLSHRNLMTNVQQCAVWMTVAEEGTEVYLAALPLFHIFGMTVTLNVPVFLGAAMVLQPNPRDIPALVKCLAKHRVTVFAGVPAMFAAINAYPDVGKYDLTSIKGVFSGSAPLPLDTLRRFEEMTGAIIFEGFGLTETSPATHINPLYGTRKPGTVGVPLPDTDARVVDLEEGTEEQPVGEAGELVIRGPQVMVGYWGRPDETAQVLRDGWFFTGDLAVMDEDGYFSIVGRKKDMILASGYNIYPDEIDRVLLDHPGVGEACTIGVPDAKRGETVKSFIVPVPGSSLTEQDVLAHCRENLAPYKVPRQVEFRDELPKSAMMKLLRRELREQEVGETPVTARDDG